MFKPVSNKIDFPAMEEAILARWETEKTFEKSLARPGDKAPYVFYDGPPFATGLPHYGHLLAGTIKDIVPRYHTMRGHHVERRFGWDCHGLPIEALAQEALGLQGSAAIREAGIDTFKPFGKLFEDELLHLHKTAIQIDQEIMKIIDKCHKLAHQILSENKSVLEKVAERLLEKEILSGDEVREILGADNLVAA